MLPTITVLNVPLLILIVRIAPGLMPFNVKIQSLVFVTATVETGNALPSDLRNELICKRGRRCPSRMPAASMPLMNCCWWRCRS